MPAAARPRRRRGSPRRPRSPRARSPSRGGVQEQVGRRLAVLDVDGAEDAAASKNGRSRPVSPSVEPQLLVVAAGGDAGGRGDAPRAPARRPATGASSRQKPRRAARRRRASKPSRTGPPKQLGAHGSQPPPVERPMNSLIVCSSGQLGARARQRLGQRALESGSESTSTPSQSKITSTRAYRTWGADSTDPWTLGGLPVPNRVVLAPLAGIGNWFVRLQAQRYGAGLVGVGDGLELRDPLRQRARCASCCASHPDERAGGRSRSSCSATTPRSCARPPRAVAAARRRPDRPQHGLPGAEGDEDGRGGGAARRTPTRAVAVARAAREGSGLPVTVKLRAEPAAGRREGVEVARRLVEEAGVAGHHLPPALGRRCATRARRTTTWRAQLVAELAGPGDRLRRDARRRARPLGVRAHRLRGGDARPRRAGQPVAVRAGARRRAPPSPTREEVVAEWPG